MDSKHGGLLSDMTLGRKAGLQLHLVVIPRALGWGDIAEYTAIFWD